MDGRNPHRVVRFQRRIGFTSHERELLEGLQEHVHAEQAQHRGNGEHGNTAVPALPPKKKHIWEIAAELMADIPEEDLVQFPVDGAAQHDHYIYGTLKREL